jgi:hypothetical protein
MAAADPHNRERFVDAQHVHASSADERASNGQASEVLTMLQIS